MPIPAAYKSQEPSTTWTRIEMLLALYNKAIEHLDDSLRSLAQNDVATNVLQRTRAATVIVAIRSGILTEYGDIPTKIDQLCEYVQQCIADGSRERIESARGVMSTLREGFEGIRTDANAMERNGEIKSIPTPETTFESVC